MNIIIVSGATATGKTTLARKLSKDLRIHTFLRDEYKENCFDVYVGVPTLRQLAKIDKESYKELANQFATALKSRTDLIIESNFKYKQRRKLQKLLGKQVNIIEIFCYASGRTLFKRYTKRYRSGERHRGHRDYLWYPLVAYESLGSMDRRYKPLALSRHTKNIDTEDFSKVDYDEILEYIKSCLI